MKTLKLISIVLFLSLAACRSKELSFGRSKTSETAKEKISLNESHTESLSRVRVVDTRDSSRQYVGMRIYPLDTFSLSVDRGFMGRASMIEYWGVRDRVFDGKDSSGVVALKGKSTEHVSESEMRKNEVLKTKDIKKERVVIWWLVILAVGLFLVWMWRGKKL